MKISLMGADATSLVMNTIWSGDKTQAARKLEVTFLQDDRDPRLPRLDIDVGYTIQMRDEGGTLRFHGNIYDVDRDRAKATVKVTCFDNLFVLNRSKTYKKFDKALPEDERYTWLAYSRRFGIELYPFIGKVMSAGERKSELRRMIIEALLVNPYIKSVDSVEFVETNHAENLAANVTLTTIYGRLTL